MPVGSIIKLFWATSVISVSIIYLQSSFTSPEGVKKSRHKDASVKSVCKIIQTVTEYLSPLLVEYVVFIVIFSLIITKLLNSPEKANQKTQNKCINICNHWARKFSIIFGWRFFAIFLWLSMYALLIQNGITICNIVILTAQICSTCSHKNLYRFFKISFKRTMINIFLVFFKVKQESKSYNAD